METPVVGLHSDIKKMWNEDALCLMLPLQVHRARKELSASSSFKAHYHDNVKQFSISDIQKLLVTHIHLMWTDICTSSDRIFFAGTGEDRDEYAVQIGWLEWIVIWCFTALSAQVGHIMPYK